MDRSCSAVTSPSLTRFARLEEATGVFFDAGYMEHLMSMGLWYKADGYLQHFLPAPGHMSDRSLALVFHLRRAWTLAAVAEGGPDAAGFASTFDVDFLAPCPRAARFRKLLHKMHAQQPRLSIYLSMMFLRYFS